MEFKPLTQKNAPKILKEIERRIVRNEEDEAEIWCDALNEMLDDLLEDDFFGTEGQLDPRGDHRN
jgi:hypothetical protein